MTACRPPGRPRPDPFEQDRDERRAQNGALAWLIASGLAAVAAATCAIVALV